MTTLTELRWDCSPETEAGRPHRPRSPQTQVLRRADSCRMAAWERVSPEQNTRSTITSNRMMSARESRSHPHSGEPTEDLSVSGPEGMATKKQRPPCAVAGGDAGGAGQFSRPHVSKYHSARSRETEQSKDRRKAQRADLRGTDSATRCSRRRTRVVTQNNRALETTLTYSAIASGDAENRTQVRQTRTTKRQRPPPQRAEGRGASGIGYNQTTRSHAQHVKKRAGRKHVGQHVNRQDLDRPRHHTTAKTVWFGARGARLTHLQTATPRKRVHPDSNRRMIP